MEKSPSLQSYNDLHAISKSLGLQSALVLKHSDPKVCIDVQTVPTETARFMDENWQQAIRSPKRRPIEGYMDLFGSGGLDDADMFLETELFDFSGRQGGDEKITAPNHLESLVSPEWDKDSLLMNRKKSRKVESVILQLDVQLSSRFLYDQDKIFKFPKNAVETIEIVMQPFY